MNFLKKIFSPAALTFSFLLLIYTLYRSEIIYYGAQREYYTNYYFISLALIFFSVTTFFINHRIKEYLIILGISSLVSLYLFEGYLTFKEPNEKSLKNRTSKEKLYENQTGNKWDKRTMIEIYQDLKKINNKIAVAVAPENYLNLSKSIFPLSGISNSETIYCNENGYYSIYQSDRYGFNNPDENWDKKEIEYLLVGDSFVHGAWVNRPNDMASVLETLSNKSTLNLGYGGNGPLIEYATLREYLNTNVKKVIWVYTETNDFRNLYNEMNEKILMNYFDNSTFTQNLKLKQNEINNLAINLIKEKEKEKEKANDVESFKFKLIKYIKIFNIRILIFPAPAPALEFKKILELTKDFVIKNNSKLYFVYLPSIDRYKTTPNNAHYYLVKDIVNKLNIPFIDINKEVFEKEEDPLKLFPFEEYLHYNVEGYKKVSQMIYRFSKD